MSVGRPEISVVIASVSGRHYLETCLEALARQQGGISAEIIVADSVGGEVRELIRERAPQVRLLAVDPPAGVPRLRAAAIAASVGDVVAITEDHCIPASDWLSSVVKAHRQSAQPAIGGSVDNAATGRLVDWAVFLCEYSPFLSPVAQGSVCRLPASNVSYKRWALEELEDCLAHGYWETLLHRRLRERGYQLVSDPRLRVEHLRPYGVTEFLVERFHLGRAFAGTRAQQLSSARRLLYALLAPAVAPLLLLRIARHVTGRPRYLGIFLRALPLLVPFTLAAAVGEWTGCVAGPGRSPSRVA